jgi:hypothetical protein
MAEAADQHRNPFVRAALAGLSYFALVFAAGFVLGVVRVLVLLPRSNETVAVLIELPIILAISWAVCRWLVARFRVRGAIPVRLAMGGLAFGLLMLAETGLSVLGFGRSLAEHLAHYRSLPALLGLLGQLAFAAFPALQK